MMACPALRSGEQFLATALEHIDCQARTIGSYGFGALADPGSGVSIALAGLLTLFVALFGIRLMLGFSLTGKDVVADVLKVGIVLTLATSWPAWRILGYDLLINGPTEIAQSIGLAAQLPGSSGDLAGRLQRVDAGLAALNQFGSGRLGVAQGDWFQLGLARNAFLIGTLAPLALIKLLTGILLAIAPLMAGLLLFGFTRSIFDGWIKGLAMAFLASLSLTIILGAQLALLEPWLQDALRRRQSDVQTLEAPVEVLAMTLAFATVAWGAFFIIGRVAFNSPAWFPAGKTFKPEARERAEGRRDRDESRGSSDDRLAHARAISSEISESFRRENRFSTMTRERSLAGAPAQPGSVVGAGAREGTEMLGSSYRRGRSRVSAAARRRDQTK